MCRSGTTTCMLIHLPTVSSACRERTVVDLQTSVARERDLQKHMRNLQSNPHPPRSMLMRSLASMTSGFPPSSKGCFPWCSFPRLESEVRGCTIKKADYSHDDTLKTSVLFILIVFYLHNQDREKHQHGCCFPFNGTHSMPLACKYSLFVSHIL